MKKMEGEKCWELGKRLGLCAQINDEQVAKFLEHTEVSKSRLGEGQNKVR